MTATLPRRDIDFLVFDWLKGEKLCEKPQFAMHDKESFNAIFELSATLASEQFYPINQLLDRDEPRFEKGEVVTPAALKPAIKAYVEAGFIGAGFPESEGGMQLPSLITRASGAFFAASSAAGTGNVGLTPANASVILLHGTAEDKKRFLPKMLEGKFSGTMCLSEPQAGSTLSDITTRAILQEDGSYRLKGNKMWISGGDHDCASNIVHLVLAKIQDENGQVIAGTKGISLFIVPKFLVNNEGELSERNDVVAAGLNHKMGWRGTTNCLMNFGEGAFTPQGKAGAIGTLVGQPHQGLACMFHMMNDARIMVGLAASSIGYSGYLHALDYAKTRVQGRLPSQKLANSPQVRLIEHADIRRMLLASKSYVEGGLALNLYCAALLDETTDEAHLLLEILTPICKSWPSQWGLAANSLAIQIHGGYGYTRDFRVEQLYRDQRLNPIHEGTHGIQALDLLARKIPMQNGAALQALLTRIAQTCSRAATTPYEKHAIALKAWQKRIMETLETLTKQTDLDKKLSNATPFMEAFGHFIIAWIWLEQLLALSTQDDFAQGKIQACEYFYNCELPKIDSWLEQVAAQDLTAFEMQEAWF